ncbi:MAG: hypothetical protein WBP64_04060 [Nitrososphaeraceae archaeon]
MYITASVNGQKVGEWKDTNAQPLGGIAPYTAIPGSRYGFRHDGLLGCNNGSCCDNKTFGPSVLCGSEMSYRKLPNLSG